MALVPLRPSAASAADISRRPRVEAREALGASFDFRDRQFEGVLWTLKERTPDNTLYLNHTLVHMASNSKSTEPDQVFTSAHRIRQLNEVDKVREDNGRQ